MFVFFSAAARARVVASDFRRGFRRRRAGAHGTRVEPAAVDAVKLGFFRHRVFAGFVGEECREIDKRVIGILPGLVRMNQEFCPAERRRIVFACERKLRRRPVSAVEITEIFRDVRIVYFE